MASAKQIAMEIIQSLPEDCTLGEVAYRLYLRELVEEAREDSGRVAFSHRKRSSEKRPSGSSRKVVRPSQG